MLRIGIYVGIVYKQLSQVDLVCQFKNKLILSSDLQLFLSRQNLKYFQSLQMFTKLALLYHYPKFNPILNSAAPTLKPQKSYFFYINIGVSHVMLHGYKYCGKYVYNCLQNTTFTVPIHINVLMYS